MPPTYDMVETLFKSSSPRTIYEIVPVFIMILQIISTLLPLPRWFYLLQFLFWRCAYNVGLGWILSWQSARKGWVKVCRKAGFGPKTDKEVKKGVSWWVNLLKMELCRKMGSGYDYDVRATVGEIRRYLMLPSIRRTR